MYMPSSLMPAEPRVAVVRGIAEPGLPGQRLAAFGGHFYNENPWKALAYDPNEHRQRAAGKVAGTLRVPSAWLRHTECAYCYRLPKLCWRYT